MSSRAQLGLMNRGAVLVDVSIDQGGCFETSRRTTHGDPTYEVDGIVHYRVANMPGAVPITSTRALTNATLPYVATLADLGPQAALARDPGFLAGLRVAVSAGLAGRVSNGTQDPGVGRRRHALLLSMQAEHCGGRAAHQRRTPPSTR